MSAPERDPRNPPSALTHEERLLVTTERFATERVRLERVVVTEQRTVTVDVRREELRMTREPIPGGEALPSLGAAAPEPIVMILHEERITIARTVVPVERVTLRVASVHEDREVSAALRREVVEVERTGEGGEVG